MRSSLVPGTISKFKPLQTKRLQRLFLHPFFDSQ